MSELNMVLFVVSDLIVLIISRYHFAHMRHNLEERAILSKCLNILERSAWLA